MYKILYLSFALFALVALESLLPAFAGEVSSTEKSLSLEFDRLLKALPELKLKLKARNETNVYFIADEYSQISRQFYVEHLALIKIGQGQRQLENSELELYSKFAMRYNQEVVPLARRLFAPASDYWPPMRPINRPEIIREALLDFMSRDFSNGITNGRVGFSFGHGKWTEFLDSVTETNLPIAISMIANHVGEPLAVSRYSLMLVSEPMVRILQGFNSSHHPMDAAIQLIELGDLAACETLLRSPTPPTPTVP
jgi:hypothetical protein